MGTGIKKNIRMAFSFAATVFVLVIVLKLLNWVPMAFQKEDLRKYPSIEEVQAKLKISKIYVPSYFPEYMQWPAAEIFAQKRPYVMINMNFAHIGSKSLALSIYQFDAGSGYKPKEDILYTKGETQVSIKGRDARLTIAVCGGHERCNSLSWEEGKFRITLMADDTPEELVRMAESML